jgi:hypothetical protein
MRNNPLSVLVLASFLIAGCAATPSVQQVRPIEGDLARYRALLVVVDAPEEIRKQNGYDITAAELQRGLIANVAASGKYATVGTGAGTGKGLEARLTIIEFNYVSGAARGTLGIMAGRAVLHVTMTLKDTETAKVLGMVNAAHSSSHAQGVFSPVTSAQISAITKEFSSRLTGQ